MAKFNPLIGTFSGKLGAQIFSYNKNGFYTRQYVKQNYAATPAQLQAKSNFNSVGAYWNHCSDAQKASWQTFANTIYRALKYSKTSKYSGYNAFAAMYLSFLKGINSTRSFGMKFGIQNILPIYYTPVWYFDPQSYRLSNELTEPPGIPISLIFDNCTVYPNLTFSAVFKLPRLISNFIRFWNWNGNENIGFQFYISRAIPATRSYFLNSLYFVLGSTGILGLAEGSTGVPYDTITLDFGFTDINLSNYKYSYSTGDKVRITPCLYSSGGQKAFLNPLDIIIS